MWFRNLGIYFMKSSFLNIMLPNGDVPSLDSLLLHGGGGGNFPKFYPGRGSLPHELLPSELLERIYSL